MFSKPFSQRILRCLTFLASSSWVKSIEVSSKWCHPCQVSWPVPGKERGGHTLFPWYFWLDFKVDGSPHASNVWQFFPDYISGKDWENYVFLAIPVWPRSQPSCLVKGVQPSKIGSIFLWPLGLVIWWTLQESSLTWFWMLCSKSLPVKHANQELFSEVALRLKTLTHSAPIAHLYLCTGRLLLMTANFTALPARILPWKGVWY